MDKSKIKYTYNNQHIIYTNILRKYYCLIFRVNLCFILTKENIHKVMLGS
jgi:hypothetical protein